MRAERQYLEFFEANERLIFEHSCDIMNALRREAYDVFKKRGFPTRKVEEYRYTNVEAAFTHNFGINARRIPFALDRKRAFRCSVPNMGTAVYFMVGDRFVPAIKKEEKTMVLLTLIPCWHRMDCLYGLGKVVNLHRFSRLSIWDAVVWI